MSLRDIVSKKKSEGNASTADDSQAPLTSRRTVVAEIVKMLYRRCWCLQNMNVSYSKHFMVNVCCVLFRSIVFCCAVFGLILAILLWCHVFFFLKSFLFILQQTKHSLIVQLLGNGYLVKNIVFHLYSSSHTNEIFR